MHSVAIGGLSGFIATAPMTALMVTLHRQLPAPQRYPLPPRQITMNLTRKLDVGPPASPQGRRWLTLALHFAYGAAAGMAYGATARRIPLPPALRGIAFGGVVWGGSYLGMLPALNILTPATQHPWQRNALMIAAHVVWGATLGTLAHTDDEASSW